MTVHPLPAEPDTLPVPRQVFDTSRGLAGVGSPRRWTSIRHNWVHADATLESDTTDRRAA